MDDSGLQQIENQRQELEQHLVQLRKALRHWQTSEIEYEGLREEIGNLPDGSSFYDVLAVARDFRAELVDDKELLTIVGGEHGSRRSRGQIVDLLARRVDYVSRNARGIEKELSDAQRRRNALSLAEESDNREDIELPLTEITEVLDDDGNIVSSNVETVGSTVPQLVEALKQVGVDDLIEQGAAAVSPKRPESDLSKDERMMKIGSPETGVAGQQDVPSLKQDSQNFGYDVKAGGNRVPSEVAGADDRATSRTPGMDKPDLGQDASTGEMAGNLPLSPSARTAADEKAGVVQQIPSNPDDTPEEAALRREMLQYGLGEVGAIVAELELEDDGSEPSYDGDQIALSFDSDFDEDDIEGEDGSEDENGMVKRPPMSMKYLEKMKDLDEKYGIKGMQNVGPDTSKLAEEVQKEPGRPLAAAAARMAALAREAMVKEALGPLKAVKGDTLPKAKKRVAFADELDIAPEPVVQAASKTVLKHRPEALDTTEPVKAAVVERQASMAPLKSAESTGEAKGRKLSLFKAARDATPQTPLFPQPPSPRFPQPPTMPAPVSAAPPHTTHVHNIVERDVTTRPSHPPDADDIDEALHRQEIAREYYKLRNRMIQQQGGFVRGGEAENYGEEITPLPMVDENGNERKISRFRAARLK